MNPSLDALTHPRPRSELVASWHANEPFVVHGLKDSVAALTRLPFLDSLDVLLKSWPDEVRVNLPDRQDEASSISASTQDARKLFANGMALLFNDVQAISPVLGEWLEAIRRDLGVSALTQGRCLVYATPAGQGTAPHFDQNLNFVLQLHGTKTWLVGPNHHVRNPLTRHTMGLPLDPELETYASLPMPHATATDSRSIVLEPGSLVFVPPGCWHSTHAATDALSLNFTYTAPAWLDVFMAALRSRLAVSSEWRETAVPARVERLDALLRELALDVPEWQAADILAVTESER